MTETNTPRQTDATEAHLLYDESWNKQLHKERLMLTWIIVILLVLWLLGYVGPTVYAGIPRSGNVVHSLLVVAIILIVLNALGVV